MPIYEYECQQCGHTLDALEKISDSPQRKCPECGRLKLKRLVSAPKFRLKGEGWYETDFKSENKRNLADSGNESAPKESAKAESGDKKPAKKDKKKAEKSSDGGKAA